MFIDTRIQDDVLTALRQDPRIKRPELIAVSVDEIGTVVLRGAVESFPERRPAAHDARRVEGAFDVIVDDLKVHPPLAHRRSDRAVSRPGPGRESECNQALLAPRGPDFASAGPRA